MEILNHINNMEKKEVAKNYVKKRKNVKETVGMIHLEAGWVIQLRNGEIKTLKKKDIEDIRLNYNPNTLTHNTNSNLDIKKIFLILDKDNKETLKCKFKKYDFEDFKDGSLVVIAKRNDNQNNLIWLTDFKEHKLRFECLKINNVIKPKTQKKQSISKWNRSEIMKKAWIIKDEEGLSLGDAIHQSWIRTQKIEQEKELKRIKEIDTLRPVTYAMPKKKVMERIKATQLIEERKLNEVTKYKKVG